MWEQLVEYYLEEYQPLLIAKVRISIIYALKEVQNLIPILEASLHKMMLNKTTLQP